MGWQLKGKGCFDSTPNSAKSTGSDVYVRGVPQTLNAFVRLMPRGQGLVGWSLWRERWLSALEPSWELGPSAAEGDAFYSDEEIARRLFLIPAMTQDALAKLETYGMPLFEKIAAGTGAW